MTFEEYYSNKRVVVTGCSSGIGRATARALVDLGAEVHGIDLKEPDTAFATFARVDLADPASIEGAAGSLGPVDALFNCAGAPPTIAPLEIVKVNFLGTRLLTQLILESMPAGSAVVNTSSDGGMGWRKKLPLLREFLEIADFAGGADWYEEHQDTAGHGYAFSKEALNVWTMISSTTLVQRGIRMNATTPGAVQTPMLETIEAAFPPELVAETEQPIGRRSSPAEQVGPLLFLNSDSASYVNGADLAVDGGYWAMVSATGQPW